MPDLENAITLMEDADGWVYDVSATKNPKAASDQNERIAKRVLAKLFLARWVVFHEFLHLVVKDNQGTLPSNIRHHWLLFQLHSTNTKPDVTPDVFGNVMLQLSGATLITLKFLTDEYSRKVGTITGSSSMFYIIDEAQAAGEACMGAFLSDDGKTERPVLRPIVRYLNAMPTNIKVIVSGTGFSLQLFQKVTNSAVAKGTYHPWESVHSTGNFFDRDAQLSYVARYLPPTYLNSTSGKHLQTRIQKWLRGRCVATNVLASQLNRSLQAQVYSPVYGRSVNCSLDGQSTRIPTQALQQFC